MLGLSFIPVNMHLLPNFMKIMVLNCHKELFVCIVNKFKFVEKRKNFLRTHYEKDFYRDETLSGKA